MKKLTEKHSKIEAILFLENNFVSLNELVSKAECNSKDIERIVNDLNELYRDNNQAFTILGENNNYLLAVKQELALMLSHLYKAKNQSKLSRALLETLSVIAYSQSITKAEIDELRGVNSEGALKVLMSQKLVKVLGKKTVPGLPNQYGTTGDFLKTFGLRSIKDLPKLRTLDQHKFDTLQDQGINNSISKK